MPTEAASAAAAPSDDAAARERAVSSNGSLIVRAPAGSGKTELLIQRFLRLLAEVEQPEAVVALTFSRKATAEMRSRLLTAIAGAAGAAPPASHQRRTWELAQAVRRRDAARGWNLLETPARLRVMTLDALALGLVERMPWLSRFGAAPHPTEAAGELYRAAARATVQRIEGEAPGAAAARLLLRHLNAEVAAAEKLLAELLEHRDQWLGLVVGTGGERRGESRDRLRQQVEAEVAAAVEAELAQVREALRASGARGLPEGSSLEAWRALADEALTKEGEQRKRWRQAHLSEAACAALHGVRRLPEARFSPAQWDVVEALFELLPVAVAELRLVFGERGECDFTEVTLAATTALETEGAPTPLAFALDARLQHLFVDEFQDTSRAQFELVEKLVADWSAGDGRTLFVVGDPMQSIYGWRNAQVELFLRAAVQLRLGRLRLEPITLSANYRSQAGLVEWCNHHFGAVIPAAGLDDCFVSARAIGQRLDGAAVEIHALPGHRRLTEAVRVAELVEAELAAAGEKAEIAILAQSRSHLDAILPELRRRGIGYQGIGLLSLAQSPVVSDLLALTRALHHPADRIAWLGVLRAPWCGLTLADLHALCADQAQAAVGELAQDAARRARLSADGRQRLERVMDVLAPAARQRGRGPARPLVEWCWRALGGPAIAPPERLGDAAAFFELLEKMDERGAVLDPAELAAAAAELLSPPDLAADARVKVMTAHKAKGLEFDTVILPGLGREPRPQPGPLLRWMERPGSDADDPPHWLVAAKSESGGADALYDFVGALQQRRRDQEQLRLLYVAATRARRRLHLLAFQPVNARREPDAPKARSPLARIWPAVEVEFERQFQQQGIEDMEAMARRVAAATPEAPATPPSLRRVTAGWTPPGLDAGATREATRVVTGAEPPSTTAPPPSRLAGELQRQVGVAVHAMLQHMAERGALRWDPERLRALLRAAGIAPAEMHAALARGRQALEQTVADARGRWILAAHEEARCEWALSGVIGGQVAHRVVDRSFVDSDGVRWIIDYKNAHHEGSDREAFLDQQMALYRPQLETYAELAAALDESRRVRCGLYFPLLGAWRELA